MTTPACWRCGAATEERSDFCLHCLHEGGPTPIRIGRFVVLEHLGTGSIGKVYRCHDPVLARDVAIKVLTHADPHGATAAISEMQAAAQASHDAVIGIYEADPKRGYYVMEYAAGGSLRTRLDTDPLWVRRNFVSLALTVCTGLRAVHVRRICHRDLKPENLLLTDSGHPKIADFGFATHMTASKPGTTLAGTPWYMAPEIWQGLDYDISVDVYSLGVIFYEMWTGALPFPAGRLWDLFEQVRQGGYIPPRELNPRTPEAVGELISHMVTPRDNRFVSIEVVLSELERMEPRRRGGKVTVDDHYKDLGAIYASRNAGRSPLLLMTHLLTAFSGLIGGLLSSDPEYRRARSEEHFPRVFAWICAVLAVLEWRPSQIIWFKYPDRCPYCDGDVCACESRQFTRKADVYERLLAKTRTRDDLAAAPSESLSFYQQMFDRIYGPANRSGGMAAACLHAYSEVAEVMDALLRLKSLERLSEVDVLHFELADVVAWFFALLNLYDREYDFERAVSDMFPGRCYRCRQEICGCPPIDTEIRLINWRRYG